ncbi:alpha/beta hydrolase [Variovorax boronicumulans]|nr:alpha/beta hydrolase-fold protein [Variovorax boronicumulans]
MLPLPPVGGTPTPPPADTGRGRVVQASVKSEATGATYPLHIYLPSGYDGATTTYPAIYITDGDAVFNQSVTRFQNFTDILEKAGKKAIVVGIGGTARRNTDYLMPGAKPYHDFLTDQLVPYVESNYRANPAKRMLSGLSNGGVFTLIAFFTEGAAGKFTFQYFFPSDPPVKGASAQLEPLESQMYANSSTREIPVTLLLGFAAANTGGPEITALHDKIAAHNYKGLLLSVKGYPGGHTPMDLPSFEDIVARFID